MKSRSRAENSVDGNVNSKQNLLEKRLELSESLFKIVVDSTPLAIYIAKGPFLEAEYVNKRFLELFGYKIKEIPTISRWYILAYPIPRYRRKIVKEWERRVKAADKSGRPVTPMEAVVTCKDGSKKTILWGFNNIGERDIFFGQDLTERKKIEAEQKRIDLIKSEFVSIASHQLRTPLTSIRWQSEALLSGTGKIVKPTRDQKKYIKTIHHSTLRMIRLVNSLLNVARLEAGTFSIDPEQLYISQVLKEVLSVLRPKIREKRLKVEKYYDSEVPRVMMDRNLLSVVFLNILSNAIDYTEKGGWIKIEETHTSDKTILSKLRHFNDKTGILIKIQDSGLGIPLNQQSDIFTKLFRADNIKTTSESGSGLGLYMAKVIIDSMHGAIWFDSIENVGTSFYVLLPEGGMKVRKGSKQLDVVS